MFCFIFIVCVFLWFIVYYIACFNNKKIKDLENKQAELLMKISVLEGQTKEISDRQIKKIDILA